MEGQGSAQCTNAVTGVTTSKIVIFVLYCAYAAVWLVSNVLFLWRMDRQPIKSRSPRLLLASSVGGFFCLSFGGITQLKPDLPCPFFLCIAILAFPVYSVPYLLRSVRLWLVHSLSLERIRARVRSQMGPVPRSNKDIPEASWKPGQTRPRGGSSLGGRLSSSQKNSDKKIVKRFTIEKQLSEKRLLFYSLCFLGALAIITIFLFVYKVFPSATSAGTEPENCRCQDAQLGTLRICGGVITGVLIINAMTIFFWRHIKDEYGIRRELVYVCILDVVLLIPFFALQFSSRDLSWPYNPLPGFIVAGHIVLSIFISSGVALYRSFGKKSPTKGALGTKLLDEGETMKDFLEDPEKRAVFRNFCARALCVENVLFLEEVRELEKQVSMVENMSLPTSPANSRPPSPSGNGGSISDSNSFRGGGEGGGGSFHLDKCSMVSTLSLTNSNNNLGPKTWNEEVRDACLKIHEEFLAEGALNELNLPGSMGGRVLADIMADKGVESFHSVVTYVENQVQADTWPLFLRSAFYKEYKENLSELIRSMEAAGLV